MADISKITLPNGSSYNIKDATARSGKQNIRNGTVSGNVNWDTLTTAGTYKIQDTTMTANYNAPVGEYAFGILVVFDSESGGENRIMQIYFPHHPSKNYMYTRMRNNNTWNDWKSLSKDADTVDGKHSSAFAAASHTHTKSQITDFPTSLPANGGNADTVDSKHASDFAAASHTHNYAGSSSAGGAATTALACTGNAATATKATQDSAGQKIDTTYIKGLSASSGSITYTKGDNTTGTITTVKSVVVTLSASGWNSNSQTISVSEVNANSIVFITPAPQSQDEYIVAYINCTNQDNGSLTFTCKYIPENDLQINLVIL